MGEGRAMGTLRNLFGAKLILLLSVATADAGILEDIFGDPNTLFVTFMCDPIGATLYQVDNVKLGDCPLRLQYKIASQDRERGYVVLRGVTAFWVSGASSSVNSINAYLKNGLEQQFGFDRPRSIPNYDVDANYAFNLEQNRILREQAHAQETQAILGVLGTTLRPNIGTHCTTAYVGTTAYTNCY
jgi:hypothetical protein